MATKFGETVEDIKSPEVQVNPEAPRSVEKPAEEIGEQMINQSGNEVAGFQVEGKKSFALYDAKAKQEGLIIDNTDEYALQELDMSAETAREELIVEVDGESIAEEIKSIERVESQTEKANIIGAVKDKNFEGSVIVKTEDEEGRIVGYALRKNSDGELEGNKIGYMKDGSIGTTYQLHDSDFAKLGQSGVLEAYENALAKEKERSFEKRPDSRFREGLIDAIGKGSNENLEANFFEKAAFLADGSSIENQQIDVIMQPNGGCKLNFKLTADAYANIKKHLEGVECNSVISYESVDGNRKLDLVDCWEERSGNIIVKISSGKKSGEKSLIGGDIRSTLGLIEITFEDDKAANVEEIVDVLDEYFREDLGIENGMKKPKEGEERRYKAARYLWHHKAESLPDNFEEIEGNMKRQEVFPGYSTMVEEGKHKEYQELSPYAVYHKIYRAENLSTIIKAGGLISTHERMKRGMVVDGMSSGYDMKSGGADSIFTRIVTEAGINQDNVDSGLSNDGVYMIFNPNILDRTDWYAYEYDRYGSVDPEKFIERQSPKEVFEDQKKKGFHVGNEQMFRTGISTDKVKAIACANMEVMKKVYKSLIKENVRDISGVPVEELLVLVKDVSDFIPISGREGMDVSENSASFLLSSYKENLSEIISLEAERDDKIKRASMEFQNNMSILLKEKRARVNTDAALNSRTDGYLSAEAVDLYVNIADAILRTRGAENNVEIINKKINSLDDDSKAKSLGEVVNFEFIMQDLKNGNEAEVALGEELTKILESLEKSYESALQKNPSLNFMDVLNIIESDIKKYIN